MKKHDQEPSNPEAGWPSEPVRDLLEEINTEELFHGADKRRRAESR